MRPVKWLAAAWVGLASFMFASTLIVGWLSPGHAVLITMDAYGEMPVEIVVFGVLLGGFCVYAVQEALRDG